MKADCSAKFLMWPKFAFYLEIYDPTLNKRHLVIQKSERSLKNMGSPAIAIFLDINCYVTHHFPKHPFQSFFLTIEKYCQLFPPLVGFQLISGSAVLWGQGWPLTPLWKS